MADWKQIRTNVGHATKKTIRKTEELAELTAMHVKLTTLNAKRDGMFEKLGRLTYKQLKTGETQAEAIAPVIEAIDTLNVQIAKQKAKIEKARAEQARARREKKQADAAEGQACADTLKDIIEGNTDN